MGNEATRRAHSNAHRDASEDIFDFNLIVFNRWGEKIWETNNKHGKWDGKRNNIDAAETVYFWVITYFCKNNGQRIKRKGTVSLFR